MTLFQNAVERDLVLFVEDALCNYSGSSWEPSRVRGEIVFHRAPGAEGRLQLVRLGLVGASPGASTNLSHKVAVSAYSGRGSVSFPEAGQAAFSVECTNVSFVNTSAGCDSVVIKLRELNGLLSGALADEPDVESAEVFLKAGMIEFSANATEGAELFGLTIDLSGSRMRVLPAPPQPRIRTLKLQPVQFATDGANLTGTNWLTHLGEAERLWGECCIHLDPQGIITVNNNPVARTSTDRCTQIRAVPTPIPYDAIPVFYVDLPLAGDGGGWTDLPGSGLDAIFVSNHADLTVLAHELGHVFGGDHPAPTPPRKPSGAWMGDPNTILVPGNGQGSPRFNSLHNCQCVQHCLFSIGGPCNFQPDLP